MALVICRVLTTLRMRRRMSRMFAMNQFSVLGSRFSVLGSRFSVLGSRFSVLSSQVQSNSPEIQDYLRTENRELRTFTSLLLVLNLRIAVLLLLLLWTSLPLSCRPESFFP